MYIQMCKPDELKEWDRKLYDIIMTQGSAFDNDWEYWINPKMTRIRRTPIGRGKRTWTEKPKRYEPNQKLEGWIQELTIHSKKATGRATAIPQLSGKKRAGTPTLNGEENA